MDQCAHASSKRLRLIWKPWLAPLRNDSRAGSQSQQAAGYQQLMAPPDRRRATYRAAGERLSHCLPRSRAAGAIVGALPWSRLPPAPGVSSTKSCARFSAVPRCSDLTPQFAGVPGGLRIGLWRAWWWLLCASGCYACRNSPTAGGRVLATLLP